MTENTLKYYTLNEIKTIFAADTAVYLHAFRESFRDQSEYQNAATSMAYYAAKYSISDISSFRRELKTEHENEIKTFYTYLAHAAKPNPDYAERVANSVIKACRSDNMATDDVRKLTADILLFSINCFFVDHVWDHSKATRRPPEKVRNGQRAAILLYSDSLQFLLASAYFECLMAYITSHDKEPMHPALNAFLDMRDCPRKYLAPLHAKVWEQSAFWVPEIGGDTLFVHCQSELSSDQISETIAALAKAGFQAIANKMDGITTFSLSPLHK